MNGAPGPRALARRFGAVAGLLALCLLLWILTPYFLTVANLLNVMEQTAINAIVAVGMTYVIISGGIDLSVGSLLAVAGVVLLAGHGCFGPSTYRRGWAHRRCRRGKDSSPQSRRSWPDTRR